MSGWTRWLRFNAVGAGGLVVQLAVLAAGVEALEFHYTLATALAVEAAVLHNFFWHRCWTWADRPGGNAIRRLLRFNLTTGVVSVGGNVALMWLLVGKLGAPYLPANLLTIACCAAANFLAGDRYVFGGGLSKPRFFKPRFFAEPESPRSKPFRQAAAQYQRPTGEAPAE